MDIKALRVTGVLRWAALLLGLTFAGGALAQPAAGAGQIVVTDLTGVVRFRIGDGDPQALVPGQALPVGARLTTAANSSVLLTFADGQLVVLGSGSRLLIRQYQFVPGDLAKSSVLLNLTDGSMYLGMGAIGQRDPSLIQVQIGARITPQAPQRARGSDAGVIVLGTATLLQVMQGRISLLVAASDLSFALATGERALVRSDGSVQLGSVRQVDDATDQMADGPLLRDRMEFLRRYSLPRSPVATAVLLATPSSGEPLEDLILGTQPTMGGGGTCGPKSVSPC